MKRYSGWGLGLLFLASCGGGAPPLGPPHAPTTTEMAAANSFEQTMGTQVSAITAAMLEPGSGTSLTSMPQSASATIKVQGVSSPITIHMDEMLSQAGFQTCTTVEANKITYTDCDFTASGASGGAGKMNGTLQRAGQTISWDLTVTIAGIQVQGQGSLNFSWKGKGSITITDTTVKGTANLDWVLGQYNVTHHMDIDVGYQKSPHCITSGSMYIERHGPSLDGAAKITWTGCKMMTVQN